LFGDERPSSVKRPQPRRANSRAPIWRALQAHAADCDPRVLKKVRWANRVCLRVLLAAGPHRDCHRQHRSYCDQLSPTFDNCGFSEHTTAFSDAPIRSSFRPLTVSCKVSRCRHVDTKRGGLHADGNRICRCSKRRCDGFASAAARARNARRRHLGRRGGPGDRRDGRAPYSIAATAPTSASGPWTATRADQDARRS
jgi:hypothetical protein